MHFLFLTCLEMYDAWRCDPCPVTQTVLHDQFGGFKLKGRDHDRAQIAKQLGDGSLEAATLVLQVYHWKFVGRRSLKSMIAVHGTD